MNQLQLEKRIMEIRAAMYKQIAQVVIVFSLLFHIAGLIDPVTTPAPKQESAYSGVHIDGEVKIARRSQRIEDLIFDAQRKGGILVQCFRNQCYDTVTAQNYGGGKDGYYVIFPNIDGKAAEKAKQISQQLLAMSD